MNEPYVDWLPLDLDAAMVTESVTIDTFGYVIEDGVERRRTTGTRQLTGYHVQYGAGSSLLETGGLRSDSLPTLYGPDTDLIQAGTLLTRDRTGEKFRVNHVVHEIQWLVATLDNVAS